MTNCNYRLKEQRKLQEDAVLSMRLRRNRFVPFHSRFSIFSFHNFQPLFCFVAFHFFRFILNLLLISIVRTCGRSAGQTPTEGRFVGNGYPLLDI